MHEKEREFIKEINIDKAIKKTNIGIFLIIISLLTYVLPTILGDFDFGVFFEIASLVFLLIARYCMKSYNESASKKYIICSMFSIGWILVYDILLLISYVENVADLLQVSYIYYFGEIILILYLRILFLINTDLAKANGDDRYKESTDWFYEKYEEDK